MPVTPVLVRPSETGETCAMTVAQMPKRGAERGRPSRDAELSSPTVCGLTLRSLTSGAPPPLFFVGIRRTDATSVVCDIFKMTDHARQARCLIYPSSHSRRNL